MELELFLKNNGISCKDGIPRKGKNNHTVDPQAFVLLHHGWLQWEPTEFTTLEEFTAEVKAWAEYKNILDTKEIVEGYSFRYNTVHTDLELIEQALVDEDITVDPDGSITKGGYSQSFKTLENYIVVYCNRYNTDSVRDKKPVRTVFNKEAVKEELKRYIRELDIKMRDALKKRIIFSKDKEAKTDAILDYILHRFSAVNIQGVDPVLNREMLKHWIWQTKRFIHGLKVPAPIFLNIYGIHQEIGKTFFIDRLVEPAKGFITEADISHMVDEKQADRWTNYYVVLLEELNFGSMDFNQKGSAISALKNRITADKVTHRELHTHTITTRPRTYSPVGTSNTSISELIVDATGMRRFFEINFNCGIDVDRIEDIRKMPVNDIWEGIDHTKDRGYVYQGSELYKDLQKVQGTYKRVEVIDHPLAHMEEDELPVKVTDEGVQEVLEMLQVDPDATIAGTGYDLLTMVRFRKDCIDWLEDNMGRGTAKYIPSEANLYTALKLRGYLVVKHLARKQRFSVVMGNGIKRGI